MNYKTLKLMNTVNEFADQQTNKFPRFSFYKIFQQQERIHSNFFSLKIYPDTEYDTVVF